MRLAGSHLTASLSRVFLAGVARLLGAVILLSGLAAPAEQRFPPPDFESGHTLPGTTAPPARAVALEYLDMAVLAACLGAATWLIYRRRSRRGLVFLGLFSMVYFGFWRKGCICSIGSIQNVTLALFDSSYGLPAVGLVFFLFPLLFALFWGRSFCAAVCPHGALQDLVLLRPLKVPGWLEHGLGVLPFVYLGAGVLFAATGSAFIICQYDPFIPIFRINGRLLMVGAGVALLLLGVFVGRPYCRWLCPFGALLKLAATVSKWRVRVTPDYCTQCRLCEASCPFGAMRYPSAVAAPAPEALARDRRRLALAIAALPVLVGLGVLVGWRLAPAAARVHPTVAAVENYLKAPEAPATLGALTPEELEVDRIRQNPRPVLEEAGRVQRSFLIGTPVFGGWVGLVIGCKLLSLSLHRRRSDYEPDRGECLSCARCFEYCPNELARRGVIPPAALPTPAAGAQRAGEVGA